MIGIRSQMAMDGLVTRKHVGWWVVGLRLQPGMEWGNSC